MSFRIFKNRSRKQDMMLLSGWLFADLLLGLMTIFMVSIPPRVTLPPTLTADPIMLSPADTQHCQGGTTAPTCKIALSETAKSDGNVNWTPSSDMSDGNNPVQFNPQTGTLSPGQSTTITISNFPCQNGSFTIKGSSNAMPVVITWQCKLPRVKLENTAVDFTIKINDVQGLLNNSPQEVDNIKRELKSEPLLTNRSVGLAIVSGGSGPDDNQAQAHRIADVIYSIMKSMQNDPTFTAFQRASYYASLSYTGRDPSIATIDVYRYEQ